MKATLKEWRRYRDMSQTELAQAVGLKTYITISRWEKGVSEPTVSQMQILRKVLKLSATDQLLLGKDLTKG